MLPQRLRLLLHEVGYARYIRWCFLYFVFDICYCGPGMEVSMIMHFLYYIALRATRLVMFLRTVLIRGRSRDPTNVDTTVQPLVAGE